MTPARGSVKWRGVIDAYRDRLPVTSKTPVVTLCEGNTPLVDAPRLSAQTGADVYLKVEGANPTGSFNDRGMTVAMSKAVEEGAKVVVCASTGNTSASAAAYAARAGMLAAVLIPEGHVALGKLAQGIDKALTEHKKAELRAWVTFVSDDQPGLDPQVVKWGRKFGLGSLPLAVFEDAQGPPAYRLGKDAEVTVLISVKQKVFRNFTFREGELTEAKVTEILKAIPGVIAAK